MAQATIRYVGTELKSHLVALLPGVEIAVDADEQQDLLVSYASAYDGAPGYVRPTVRVECGPRSSHAPSEDRRVVPYLAEEVDSDFAVLSVPTILPERTFWEKVFILHGHHCRFRDEAKVPAERNRLSRHYYDVAVLMASPVGPRALGDVALLDDVRSRNKVTFPAAWRKYDEGVPGSFLILPQPEVRKALETDYEEMQSMVFGDVPTFAWILEQLEQLQARLNTPKA